MRVLILDPVRDWSFLEGYLSADYVLNGTGAFPAVDGTIDLALVGDERHWEVRQAIRRVQAAGIPVLFFPDGILEWRNQFSNPLLTDPIEAVPTVFMPVLSDKVACIGRSQARVLESWGNAGKCEIVGSPRLDYCIGLRAQRAARGRSGRDTPTLLVQTARSPAFNETQEANLLRALSDIDRHVSLWSERASTIVRVIWRLSGIRADKLPPLQGERSSLQNAPLREVLSGVDAVISTPSTAMLEAMACGIPTALLDYNNGPQYVPAAWSITSSEHVSATISELLDPPPPRLLCQEYFARDSLEFHEPAAARAARLISEMIRIRKAGLDVAPGRGVVFPSRILGGGGEGDELDGVSLRELYPGHSVFGTDTARLQVEVAELRITVRELYHSLKFEKTARRVVRALRATRRLLKPLRPRGGM